ncbi:hypothetical protein HAX54_008014, partial [Datura stramonium]|nr:hypothetical protein [Datura stramonium]
YSPVESNETPMEHWFELKLAFVHCFDPALHWWFANRDRRLAALSLVQYLLPQFAVFHLRFPDTILQLTDASPVLP